MVTPISASAMCQASTCTGGVWFLVPTVRLWEDDCVKHCISLVGEGGRPAKEIQDVPEPRARPTWSEAFAMFPRWPLTQLSVGSMRPHLMASPVLDPITPNLNHTLGLIKSI